MSSKKRGQRERGICFHTHRVRRADCQSVEGGPSPLGSAVTVLYERPPASVWDRAVKLGADDNTVFAYGRTYYVPSGIPLTPDLALHEATHTMQQGEDVDGWWDRYFEDVNFRFEQELEAYRTQYKCLKNVVKDRNNLARQARLLAVTLSGPLYGKLVSGSEAYARITGH